MGRLNSAQGAKPICSVQGRLPASLPTDARAKGRGQHQKSWWERAPALPELPQALLLLKPQARPEPPCQAAPPPLPTHFWVLGNPRTGQAAGSPGSGTSSCWAQCRRDQNRAWKTQLGRCTLQAQQLTLTCRMSPSWADQDFWIRPVRVSRRTMKPEEKPAATLRPLGLTARQRMSPALAPLASRNSCCRAEREQRDVRGGAASPPQPRKAEQDPCSPPPARPLLTPPPRGPRHYLPAWLPVVDEAKHRVCAGDADAAVGGRHGAERGDRRLGVQRFKGTDHFACSRDPAELCPRGEGALPRKHWRGLRTPSPMPTQTKEELWGTDV